MNNCSDIINLPIASCKDVNVPVYEYQLWFYNQKMLDLFKDYIKQRDMKRIIIMIRRGEIWFNKPLSKNEQREFIARTIRTNTQK